MKPTTHHTGSRLATAICLALAAPFAWPACGTRWAAVATARASMLPVDDDRVPLVDDLSEYLWEPDEGDPDRPDLRIEGDGAISPLVATTIEPFLEAARIRLEAARKDGGSLLVVTRVGEVAGAYTVDDPGGSFTPVLEQPVWVRQAGYVPRRAGEYLLRVETDGSEDYQIVRANGGKARLVTDGSSRHGAYVWSPSGATLAYTGNARDATSMDVYLSDGWEPADKPALPRDGSWNVLSWSPDETEILLQKFESFTRSSLHLWDLARSTVRRISAGDAAYAKAKFARNRVYALSDRGSDWMHLQRWTKPRGTWEDLTPAQEWDAEEISRSADSRYVAFTVNEDGLSRLYLYDSRSGEVREQPLPFGPAIVEKLAFVSGADRLAMAVDRLIEPANAYVLDLGTGEATRWTDLPAVAGAGPPPSPRLIRVPSFDGLEIPTWIFDPPQTEGPSPVLLWIHGGPEEQFRPCYTPLIHYFTNVLGIAVVAPNIRGSAGYGDRFLALDGGLLREDAIRDVGALLTWLDGEPAFDGERVGIYGGSYGGYVVLASLIAYPDRLRAGCDYVGVSNFVTFLENTSGYRREARRAEYGDESDPQTRAFLEEISPLGRAGEIRAPLFVAHGANDPRVPVGEAEQIVEAVRESGVPVWYLVAEDEGHGFKMRRNRDVFYSLLASFFHEQLNAQPTPGEDESKID